MNRFGLFIVAGLCLPAPGVTASAAETDDPLAIIDDVYSQYEDGGEPIAVPDAYFSAPLLKLWRDVDAGSLNGVEKALGFEIFTNSTEEEDDFTNLRTRVFSDNYVIADFHVMLEDETTLVGEKRYLMYKFDETDDGWKIDDLDWGRGKKTLRGMLTEILEVQKLR